MILWRGPVQEITHMPVSLHLYTRVSTAACSPRLQLLRALIVSSFSFSRRVFISLLVSSCDVVQLASRDKFFGKSVHERCGPRIDT